jgi:hypothetical protein
MKLLVMQICPVSSLLNADILLSLLPSDLFIVCHEEVSIKIYSIMLLHFVFRYINEVGNSTGKVISALS